MLWCITFCGVADRRQQEREKKKLLIFKSDFTQNDLSQDVHLRKWILSRTFVLILAKLRLDISFIELFVKKN